MTIRNLAAAVLASSFAMAQTPLVDISGSIVGNPVTAGLGSTLAAAGDTNADGFEDFLLSSLGWSGALTASRVWLMSGKDGAILRTWGGSVAGDQLGTALVRLGDVDGDGVDDLAISAPGHDFGGTDTGSIFIRSGSSGALLVLIKGQQQGDRIGMTMAALGDTDGDGIPDLAYSIRPQASSGWRHVVRVVSGSDGALLREQWTLNTSATTELALAGPGDLDGDGLGDLVVSSIDGTSWARNLYVFRGAGGGQLDVFACPETTFANYFGRAVVPIVGTEGPGSLSLVSSGYDGGQKSKLFVLDARDGSTLAAFDAPSLATGAYGLQIADAGDVDGDGRVDYAVSDYGWHAGTIGRVFIQSSADGRVLKTIETLGDGACDRFGFAMAALADSSGDGLPELVVSAPNDDPLTPCPGAGWAFVPGRVIVLSPSTVLPQTYCSAMPTTSGCQAQIGYEGVASPTALQDFAVTASSVPHLKPGLLLWSHAQASTPFHGGTLCVAAPLIRTAAQSSGGGQAPPVTPSEERLMGSLPFAANCSGAFRFAFTPAYQYTHMLEPGTRLFAQWWYRDPGAPAKVGLTEALQWTFGF